MKKYYYAVMTEQKNAHVLTVPENNNLISYVNKLHLLILHPCKTYAEAVKIVEAWKKEVKK